MEVIKGNLTPYGLDGLLHTGCLEIRVERPADLREVSSLATENPVAKLVISEFA